MTREESIEASQRPGKFEGEAPWTAYFWEKVLEGAFDDEEEAEEFDTLIAVFHLRSEDRAVWPELPPDQHVLRLWEDDQGFVYSRLAIR